MGVVPLLLLGVVAPPSTLIQGGTVIDGTGRAARVADVRLMADRVVAIGKLRRRPGDWVVSAKGRVVAPGFIDAHSHADGELEQKPDAQVVVRQGITTVVVGQDGSSVPLPRLKQGLAKSPPVVNVASFTGHGSLRRLVMGEDYKRHATADELRRMGIRLDAELKQGSLGLSTGLEYDPGFYAPTSEIQTLARRLGPAMVISHIRDEENEALAAMRELTRIAALAGGGGQISHIKLASSPVWGRAKSALALLQPQGLRVAEITADVYPYRFWQSSITVLIPTRDWSDRAQWRRGLEEVGGAANVRLARYSPNPSWENQTIAQIAQKEGKDAVEVIQQIVAATQGEPGGTESVIVTAMTQADLDAFVRHPRVMFCTDGGLSPRHPRGAGSFPRILGEYVRNRKVLPLAEAVRKMTSFPAQRFRLGGRGVLRVGAFADLVVFDAKRVIDRATVEKPSQPPLGIERVFVNGRQVVGPAGVTSERPGRFLRPDVHWPLIRRAVPSKADRVN